LVKKFITFPPLHKSILLDFNDKIRETKNLDEFVKYYEPYIEGFQGNGKAYGKGFDTKEYKNLPLSDNHENDDKITRFVRGWWP